MKEQVGIVIVYNGYSGKIFSDRKEYLLLDNNVVNQEKIQVNDEVSFISEIEKDIPIARFVRKRVKN